MVKYGNWLVTIFLILFEDSSGSSCPNKCSFLFEDKDEPLTINMNEFAVFDDKLLTAKDADRLDEKKAPPPASTSNKMGRTAKRWKYGVSLVIWLLVAFPLLTVREKIPIEHTIAIDSTSGKSIKKTDILNISRTDFFSCDIF